MQPYYNEVYDAVTVDFKHTDKTEGLRIEPNIHDHAMYI